MNNRRPREGGAGLGTADLGREGMVACGTSAGLGQIGHVVRLGGGFGVCVVLDLGICNQRRRLRVEGEGLATAAIGREGTVAYGLAVGLGQIGRVVRLGGRVGGKRCVRRWKTP